MSASRFRAVLFDFDGTLADSYDAITLSVNHVRAANGLAPLSEADIRGRVGFGLLVLMAEIVPGGDAEANAAIYRAHHHKVFRDHTRLLPGVANALRLLHDRGVRMAVCSNKAVVFTRQLVDALGIGSYIEAVLGPEDAGRPKPDPAMLLVAMEMLGADRNNTLYVGDMTVDIETARAAGLSVWVVPSGSNDAATLLAAKPDRLLRDMSELPAALLTNGEPPA